MADETASTATAPEAAKPTLTDHSITYSPEHQTLLDRFKSLFQGALDYVQNHLPEHPNLKGDVVRNIQAAWDNSAAIIKGAAETEFASLKSQGEQALTEAAASVVESNATPTTAETSATSSAGTDTTPSAPASTDTPTK